MAVPNAPDHSGRLFPAYEVQPSSSSASARQGNVSETMPDRRYAMYPPVVVENNTIGYVRDVNGCEYSRDVGRSSVFSGEVFYQFGDTFCKNLQGEYVGVTSHTVAHCGLRDHPRVTQYQNVGPDGLVESFIPLTNNEKRFDAGYEMHGGRTTLWSFGGIIEDAPGIGSGWCFFEKGEAYKDGRMVPRGVGVARVYYNAERHAIYARRPTEHLLFGAHEPRWGTFSTLVENGYIYLWGHHHNMVLLARVRVGLVLSRSAYEFWNGEEYTIDPRSAAPIFMNTQHGGIFRSNLFAPDSGIRYVFIGVSADGDSKINMGCSKTLEGPFEMFKIADARGLTQDGYTYCIYPHPWACREEDGDVLVTWSEAWPGGVVASRLRFQMGPKYSQKYLYLNDYPYPVATALATSPECAHIAEHTSTTIAAEGRFVRRRRGGPPEGVLPLHLSITGDSDVKVEEAVLLLVTVVERQLRERREEEAVAGGGVVEDGDAEEEEEGEASRRRRLSNSLRRFFKRLSLGDAQKND